MSPTFAPLRRGVDQPITSFSAPEVQRWNASRGRITQTVRGSHVDITVRLYHAARNLFVIAVAAAGCGVLYIGYQILYAVFSGRVQMILDAVKGGR
jgi:hypothetical protein